MKNEMLSPKELLKQPGVAGCADLAIGLAKETEALRAEVERLREDLDHERRFLDTVVSKAPEPLVELGAHLASLLDEDQWPTAERYLNAAAVSCSAAEARNKALEAAVQDLVPPAPDENASTGPCCYAKEGSTWVPQSCYCGNRDDAQTASLWAAEANAHENAKRILVKHGLDALLANNGGADADGA